MVLDLARVVKAFSLDYDLVEYIDSFESGTRSDHVNWALRSYFFSNAGDSIYMMTVARDYYRDELAKQQGVKYHLVELFKALFRVR